MKNLSPDAPKSHFFSGVRVLIRFARLLKHKAKLRRKIVLGTNVSVGPSASLMIPDYITIGNDFSCGRNFFAQTNLIIGDECLISSDVSMVGHDHYLDDPNMSAYWSGRKSPSTIRLVGDNFIGYRATIVGDVIVGKGAVVAAGAVVVKDVEPYSVVAGVPAKHIKYRFNV